MNHKIVIFLASGKTFAFENVEDVMFSQEHGQLHFEYFGSTHQEKKLATFDLAKSLGWSVTKGLKIKLI
ncbi:hypothetical protein AB6M97_10285 [Streptococcus hillyeri]|uniref:Uncharacterized protein n=1 Tax=Streptococcus hillyeri TaxID=2282420 RepID=A0A3L9DR92_9STRE|nr:hypothetical protein [Streptococcus hillyeri]RLY03084.1 hypothetical protein EAF07_05960 [Streptococcus hillyeri]